MVRVKNLFLLWLHLHWPHAVGHIICHICLEVYLFAISFITWCVCRSCHWKLKSRFQQCLQYTMIVKWNHMSIITHKQSDGRLKQIRYGYVTRLDFTNKHRYWFVIPQVEIKNIQTTGRITQIKKSCLRYPPKFL